MGGMLGFKIKAYDRAIKLDINFAANVRQSSDNKWLNY